MDFFKFLQKSKTTHWGVGCSINKRGLFILLFILAVLLYKRYGKNSRVLCKIYCKIFIKMLEIIHILFISNVKSLHYTSFNLFNSSSVNSLYSPSSNVSSKSNPPNLTLFKYTTFLFRASNILFT